MQWSIVQALLSLHEASLAHGAPSGFGRMGMVVPVGGAPAPNPCAATGRASTSPLESVSLPHPQSAKKATTTHAVVLTFVMVALHGLHSVCHLSTDRNVVSACYPWTFLGARP